MFALHLLALTACIGTSASAVYQGFNYGPTYTDGSAVVQSDFQNLFTTAQNLVGTSGFASARLYTMIQAGTTNTPTQAIAAAIDTETSLLLGLWGSAGPTIFANEVAALTSAIQQYGTNFTKLIAGISVGSEDLYRNSPIGIENLSGVGANPSDIVSYISQVRSSIAGTAASGALVGHVDTWTAWVNGSNDAVISACDFIGVDAYPYFQNTEANSIDAGYQVFFQAYNNTQGAVGSKPVWITETGWPVSGPTSNLAIASITNAQTYWDQVGCAVFGKINTWWFTLQDSYPTTPAPSFGIVGTQLSTTPLFNLTCPAVLSSVAADVTPNSASNVATSSSSSITADASSITADASSSSTNTSSPNTSASSDVSTATPSSAVTSGAACEALISSGIVAIVIAIIALAL
jgi:glucan endo-1,3-beta-D-glucosidase